MVNVDEALQFHLAQLDTFIRYCVHDELLSSLSQSISPEEDGERIFLRSLINTDNDVTIDEGNARKFKHQFKQQ